MAISWRALLRCATFGLLLFLGFGQVAIDMVTDGGQVAQCVVNINLAIFSLNMCGTAIASAVHTCGDYDQVNVEKKIDASLGVIRDVASRANVTSKGGLEAELNGVRTRSGEVQQAEEKVHKAIEAYNKAVRKRYHNITRVGTAVNNMERTCASNVLNIFGSMTNAAAYIAASFDGCTQSTNRGANCAGQILSIANGLLGIVGPAANMGLSCAKLNDPPPPVSRDVPIVISYKDKKDFTRNRIRAGYWCAVNVNIGASYLANAALGIVGSKTTCSGPNVSKLSCSAQIEAVFSSLAFAISYIAAAVTSCANLERPQGAQCAADISDIVASVFEICNAAQMINRDDSCGGLARGYPNRDKTSWQQEYYANRTGVNISTLQSPSPLNGWAPNASNALAHSRRLSAEGDRAKLSLSQLRRAIVERGVAEVAHVGELLV